MRLRAVWRAVAESWDAPAGLRACVAAGCRPAPGVGPSTLTGAATCDPKAAGKRRDASAQAFPPIFLQ